MLTPTPSRPPVTTLHQSGLHQNLPDCALHHSQRTSRAPSAACGRRGAAVVRRADDRWRVGRGAGIRGFRAREGHNGGVFLQKRYAVQVAARQTADGGQFLKRGEMFSGYSR